MPERVGRAAIVTGAARGIGAAIARRLAAEGHSVAVLDLDEGACVEVRDEIVADGGCAIAVQADVTDEAAVARVLERVVEDLGPPSILVNNAGITRDNLIFKMPTEEWDAVIAVHLKGAFLMTRATQSHMVEQGFGRIVNISSTSAMGNRGQANYAAAKAGVQGFTKTLAVELGRFGITANCVAPGFVETEMTAATAARLGMTFEDFKARAVSKIPVGRGGVPADIAAMVNFFASDESGYVSGQVVYVDGARHG